jgi:hypothetical protein
MKTKKLFALVLPMVFILLVGLELTTQPRLAIAQEETTRLQVADSAIRQAFNSVQEAESAGANVSLLVAKLNTAGKLLADAENAYRNGSIDMVAAKTDDALAIADSVKSEALSLRDTAFVTTRDSYWATAAFTAAGVAVFLTLLSFVWRRFSRASRKKMLTLKPEVTR